MKYTSCNKNSLRQLKTASENLPIQQNFFLILAEFRREKAKYYAGCFQHIDGVRLLNFREAFRHAQQNFRSSENLLHDEASQSKNVGLLEPRIKNQESRIKDQESRIKIQDSRFKSQELRIKNQEEKLKALNVS